MNYTIKPTSQFTQDYRRAMRAGQDLEPLNAVISALAAGGVLPPECRDRPLTGRLAGFRECRVREDRVLVYRLEGEAPVLTLLRTGGRMELYRKGGSAQMKNGLKSLYRSPVKTAVTLLLLAAAAFLFLYNLGEYAVSDREYREARDKYEGVLTVDGPALPDNHTIYDYFLLTDETNPGNTYDLQYETYHQSDLGSEVIETLSALSHVSGVERRWLTAGVSPEYVRLDTDTTFYPYYARCIVTATVKYRYDASVNGMESIAKYNPEIELLEFVTLEDVEVLAGDPAWLKGQNQHTLRIQNNKEEYREKYVKVASIDYLPKRENMFVVDNLLYTGDADILQPGRRYLLVLRNNCVDQPIATKSEEQGVYPEGYVHMFNVGDDSLIGWWPYFTDITDLPEGWLETEEFADLRELIQVTNDDVHTFDVVYGDDMAAQRRVAEGRMVCEEGRFLTPEDAGQPVCVVSTDFLTMSGLKVGDSITLDLGNYLSEQYAPLGAVAVTRGRQNTEYTRQEFTIIGSWRDLNEGNHVYRDRFWCWSNNAIFVPTAFLPECRNAEGHEFKPREISFIVGNAEEIVPFMEECLPLLDEMGLSYVFSDGGWSNIALDLMQARTIALVKLLVFGGAAVFTLVLTVWLFIGRKKREYAIYRALGMPMRGASMQLYMPFLVLGGVAAIIGAVAARVFSLRQLAASSAEVATAHPPAGPGLYVLGTLGFLLVLAAFAWGGILLIRRKSVLELLSGDGARRKERVREAYGLSVPSADGPSSGASRQLPPGEASRCGGTGDEGSTLPSLGAAKQGRGSEWRAGGTPEPRLTEPQRDRWHGASHGSAVTDEGHYHLGGSRSRNWGERYLRRLLGRNLGRSALSLLLAALLAFAFGLVTVLRGIYANLYQDVEVKAVFTGGLGYERAVKIAESGYVREPYYEYVSLDGMIEMSDAEIVLTNRLDRLVSDPVTWLEGWDEVSAMNTAEKVIVISASHAKEFNVGLGDKVRLNEVDWWNHVSAFGMQPLEPGETAMDRRDKLRPFFQVVGIIQSDAVSRTVFIPAEARQKVLFLVPELRLDIAEYTLIDYHQAVEFTDYVKGQLDKSQNVVKFTMDTSYADRMYKIHRLIESLYPLAVAAALLLGGVLPGLIVLHSSREISILRALGVKARDCVLLYTLAEVLCALAGLVLGIAAVIVALRPELGEVIVPFAIYLAAHLAACALGSGVFAWLCARKHVLAQLQAKE